MYLGTTTYKWRSKDLLKRTRDIAKDLKLYNPNIIEYGPGGSVRFMTGVLSDENKGRIEQTDYRTNNIDKFRKFMIRFAESAIRKTNLFNLESTETFEIAQILSELSPRKIYAIDIERKVLDAVARVAKINNHTSIECIQMDISKHSLGLHGDIVFAYNIVQRTVNPKQALENIAKSTRIGGLLSTTSSIVPDGFTMQDKGIYLRLY